MNQDTEPVNNQPRDESQNSQQQISEQPKPLSPEEKQQRLWAMLCHLTALSCFLWIPFGNILGPLVIWLIKRNDIPLVDSEGKKSLNFQISITIYAAVAGLLCFVIIGIPILIALLIFDFVIVTKSAIRASEGKYQEYPITIRFIK